MGQNACDSSSSGSFNDSNADGSTPKSGKCGGKGQGFGKDQGGNKNGKCFICCNNTELLSALDGIRTIVKPKTKVHLLHEAPS